MLFLIFTERCILGIDRRWRTKTYPHTKKQNKKQNVCEGGKCEGELSNFEVNLRTSEEPDQKHQIVIMNDGYVGPKGHLKCTGSSGFEAKAIVVIYTHIYLFLFIYISYNIYICGPQYRHHFFLHRIPRPK